MKTNRIEEALDKRLDVLLRLAGKSSDATAYGTVTRGVVAYLADLEAVLFPRMSIRRWQGVRADALWTFFELKRVLATTMVTSTDDPGYTGVWRSLTEELERHRHACREGLWPALAALQMAGPAPLEGSSLPGYGTDSPLDVSPARQLVEEAAIALASIGARRDSPAS